MKKVNQTAKKLVSATNIQVSINGRQILKDINLSIEENQIVSVVGPNGAGKSTLAKLLLGLMSPSSGKIEYAPSLKIGYMPQKFRLNYLLPLSVKDFLRLGKYYDRAYFHSLTTQLGLKDVLETQLINISGGELQRVLLTRALLNKPNLLILDEPTQGIDLSGQLEFYDLIQEIKEKLHCSIFMISHDLHFVMAGTSEVVCLNQHICCQGHPEDICKKPEFLNLFGKKEQAYLAFYMHEHHHKHNLDGSIEND